MRYIRGSDSIGVCYSGSSSLETFGYSDSDWAGDVNDRKSTSGYIFLMGVGAVSWCSRKQRIVATSTCEAEYIAMNGACKEKIWLRRLVSVLPPGSKA